ncbi:MAG: hypothetical protein V3R16_04325, partial [Nitrospirales bacterium]
HVEIGDHTVLQDRGSGFLARDADGNFLRHSDSPGQPRGSGSQCGLFRGRGIITPLPTQLCNQCRLVR